MFGVAIVLFALAEYDSPALAGIVTFASIFPGLLIAPIAGRPARPPRTRPADGVRLRRRVRQPRPDRRAVAGRHAAGRRCWSLIVIVTSLTSILSIVGLRTIYPADGAVAPVGAGQRHRCERLRRGDDPGPADRRQPGRVPRRAGGDDRDRHPVRSGRRWRSSASASRATATVDQRAPAARRAATGLRYAWSNRTIRGLGFSMIGHQPVLGRRDDHRAAHRPRRPATRARPGSASPSPRRASRG